MREDVEATVSSTGGDEAPPVARAALLRGSTVGRFLVVRERGEGGMGRIYEAYDPELDRKVAIKLVRGERITARGAVIESERLLREAQAMAKIAHANVVAVFEVGAIDDQIFVAMELVDGPDLAAWLALRRRGWREIVDVFVAAGRGLAATHAAGLVHRDFKPSNVVVSEGGPKVLDFGLAIAEDETPGEIAGTPRYMAPEQRAGRVDARADQYSFCSALEDALMRAASAPPRAVRRVIARGLREEPAARFASMSELLDALVRTRRRGAWIAGVAAAAVAAYAAVLLVRGGDPPCAGGRGRLAGVWDAPSAIRVARAFAGVRGGGAAFARVRASLDRYADAWVDLRDDACRATEVRHEQSAELLDLRMACLDEREAELGALVTQLAQVDAGSLAKLEDASHALTSLAACSKAASLRAPEALPNPFITPAIATIRGEMATARALGLVGKNREGAALAAAQIAHARALGWRPLIGETQFQEGVLELAAERYADGERLLFDALWNAEASRHDRLAAQCWVELVSLVDLESTGYERAEAWGARAEAAIARLGGDAELTAQLADQRASIDESRGRTADARAAWMRAREVAATYLPDDAVELADYDNKLALAAKGAGDFDDAERRFRHALAAYEHAYGPTHPHVAGMLINLAAMLDEKGDTAQALTLIHRALAIYEADPDANPMSHALAEGMLSSILHTDGDADGSYAAARREIAIYEKTIGPDALELAGPIMNMSIVLRDQGHADRALVELERALAICMKHVGPDDPRTNMIRISLGETYLQLDDAHAARAQLEPALAVYDKVQPDGILAAFARFTLGRAYLRLGDAARARPLVERALAFREKVASPEQLAETRLLLAEALWDVDRERARALIEQARPVIDPQPHDPDLDLATWEKTHPPADR
ncbi:MAG TPA: serine/threonine-protein kinase [Kofleriaceae bacterium]|nr:serine/threonine-protein kinase [Kofleriaceae bacterium]